MQPTCVAMFVAICVTIRQLALLPIRVPMFVPTFVTICQRPLESMCVCVPTFIPTHVNCRTTVCDRAEPYYQPDSSSRSGHFAVSRHNQTTRTPSVHPSW